MIAYDIIENHLTSPESRNNFSEIRLILIEKEAADLDVLVSSLDEKIKAVNLGEKIKVYFGSGGWESFTGQIKGLLSESNWGFVYADPFSTELDIDVLVATIEKFKKLKDIFVFANFNTLARQTARAHVNDIQRVCKSIGVDPQRLSDNEDFSDLFKSALQKKISALKTFVTGVAIPITKKDKLITADYFYLILATDSVMVADGFLEAYEKVVNQHKMPELQQSFWTEEPFLQKEILRILGSVKKRTLQEIVMELFNDFLSWKVAIQKTDYRVPTIKNIVTSLNTLHKEEKVEFVCSNQFVYKRTMKEAKKGGLKFSEIHSGRDTGAITVKLKR